MRRTYLKAIHLGKQLLDVSGGHPLGIKGHDLIFDLVEHGLALSDELGLELAVSIPEYLDFYKARGGFYGFWTVAIAVVIRVRALVFGIAQEFLKLGLKSFL